MASVLVSSFVLAAALVAGVPSAQAASYGSNLVVNGNAEAGLAGWTAYDGTPLFDAAAYGPNWVQLSEPGPVDRGTSLFVGGSGKAFAAGYQAIDLSANSADINTGSVGYSLSGWLGGWTSQTDNALVYVSFVNASGTELASATLGPMTPELRNNTTGLFFTQTSGLLPVGTQQLLVSLSMERGGGGDNDGYADNLSLTLTPVPEPGAAALMLLGLGLLGGAAKRRRA